MKLREMKEKVGADTISNRGGIITFRWEFFYRHGKDSGDCVALIVKAFPNAKVVDQGEVWKAFRGGASTSQSSHWFVKIVDSETLEVK